jgi:hypothetical protein
MRRAFGTRGPGPAVCLTSGPDGLRARARFIDAAVEYHASEAAGSTAETLWLPFQVLDDCQGKKDDPVHVEVTGKNRVTAQWRDGSVPQIVQYDINEPADADSFPAVPETFAENPPGILQALVEAGESADAEAVRYAVNCIQLRATGRINATDGRQLLVQSGFVFPWTEDLLIPRSKVFTSPELAGDQPILVGKSGDWVALRTGPWTVWLAINTDGRFPDMERHIPLPADAKTRCQFSPADAEFLVQAIPRLPCDEEFNLPITVDLNGQIAIRAKAADQPKVTEVVLTSSTCSGEPIRLNMNRKFLARAARLGFRELLVYGDKVPVLCQDASRQFVWALLDPNPTIPPPKDPIRIESGQAATDIPTPKPKTRRRTPTVSQPTNNSNGNGQPQASSQPPANEQAAKTNGQAHRTGRKPSREDVVGLIRQAEATRSVLRDALVKTNELVKALKQHGRRNRAIQNTLASLRQLKTLGV